MLLFPKAIATKSIYPIARDPDRQPKRLGRAIRVGVSGHARFSPRLLKLSDALIALLDRNEDSNERANTAMCVLRPRITRWLVATSIFETFFLAEAQLAERLKTCASYSSMVNFGITEE